jgi:hypothetical protein
MAKSKDISGHQPDQTNRSNANNPSKGGISMVAVPAKEQAETKQGHQVQFKSMPARSNESVVQLAGTKPNTSSVGGKYRIKLSSDRESFTYKNRIALGLGTVLPQYFPIEKFNTGDVRSGWSTKKMVVSVELQNGAFVVLKTPIPLPGNGKELLVIDSVGFEADEEEQLDNPVSDAKGKTADKIFMDIKIGTYTKSGEQFELEGANFATRFFKKIEHNIKDLKRDSRDLGYDIDLAGDKQKFEDAFRNRQQGLQLRQAMAAIIEKLTPIRNTMRNAPITFVGSSLLIAFNLDRPANSDVKLIDPDHPIVLDDVKEQLARETPADVMTSDRFTPTPDRWDVPVGSHGMAKPVFIPGRKYSDYVNKWQSGFGTGMVNFIQWLTDKMNTLPR